MNDCITQNKTDRDKASVGLYKNGEKIGLSNSPVLFA